MSAIALKHRIAVTTAALLLVVLTLLSLWHGGRIALSDADTLATRWTVTRWRLNRGPAPTQEQWLRARDDLRAALQITPDNPQIHDDLGYLHSSRAQAMGWPRFGSEEEALRQTLLTEAIRDYRAATVLRPTFPYSWAYLALTKQRKGELDAEFWVAFDKALQYGRTEAGLQPTLAQMAFAHGKALSPARQRLVFSMITSSHGAVRKQLSAMIEQNGVTVPGF
jgi:tetratricopeptide (TPR) repeat protein